MTHPTLESLQLPIDFVGGACDLPHLSVLQAEGPDAVSFLHNQLTHDFALLQPDQARLCGYCSAKGRMLASFVGFKRSPEQILLICSTDLAAATLKRLTMFVLRAKVRLTDVTAQFTLKGWVGPALMQAIHNPAQTAWQHRSHEGGDLITLYPALGQPRALWLGTPAHPGLAALTSLPLSDWLGLEVLSGIAQVQAATADAFVPQMLNYESVDGVSFKKGCYPGQEVVARSQFRGAIKRRAHLFMSHEPLVAGSELFLSHDTSQPAGIVAQSAPWSGRTVLIASVQTSALDATESVLQDSQGHRVNPIPLPYELRHDL
jgi:tRNA-modifying protein YgfZ